ncbi:MAG: hypothetical protein RL385_5043 [Pseudomonadota bacterium]|jgi:hypothetical protein
MGGASTLHAQRLSTIPCARIDGRQVARDRVEMRLARALKRGPHRRTIREAMLRALTDWPRFGACQHVGVMRAGASGFRPLVCLIPRPGALVRTAAPCLRVARPRSLWGRNLRGDLSELRT